jgi:hypothetical protein
MVEKCPVCGSTLITFFTKAGHSLTTLLVCPHAHPYSVPYNVNHLKALMFTCDFKPTQPQPNTNAQIPIMPQFAQPNNNDKTLKFAMPLLNGKTLLFTDLNKTDIALSTDATNDSIGIVKKSRLKTHSKGDLKRFILSKVFGIKTAFLITF